MTTELIERLAQFDFYVMRLAAHDWHGRSIPHKYPHKWDRIQAEHKKLQEDMKVQNQAGNRYPMQAYWAFMNWATEHNDIELREQIVQRIRNDLAIEATTQLINPSPEE